MESDNGAGKVKAKKLRRRKRYGGGFRLGPSCIIGGGRERGGKKAEGKREKGPRYLTLSGEEERTNKSMKKTKSTASLGKRGGKRKGDQVTDKIGEGERRDNRMTSNFIVGGENQKCGDEHFEGGQRKHRKGV